jgi:predicted 3-demethylubiquinone-9 3-methyltransferase (glyoxalase superfamily)
MARFADIRTDGVSPTRPSTRRAGAAPRIEGGSMPKITTFLTYEGSAEDAAAFYVSIFPNSRVTRTTRYLEGAPMPVGTVMTVEFELDGEPFVALNGGEHFRFTDGISLSVDCKDQKEIDHYWSALTADGGEEVACGWLRDKFGVSWQINTHVLTDMFADADTERANRAFAAMMKMKKIVIADLERAFEGEQGKGMA